MDNLSNKLTPSVHMGKGNQEKCTQGLIVESLKSDGNDLYYKVGEYISKSKYAGSENDRLLTNH